MEPSTGDIFKSRFQDSYFYEEIFPRLESDKQLTDQIKSRHLEWQSQKPFLNDPRTKLVDVEVKQILHLAAMLDKLPDGFNDAENVTRSHIEAANVPARI